MFVPGKIIKTFKTKKGKEIVIRYLKWEDLDELTRYINKLSAEDTFVTFSGEKIAKEEEGKTLANWFLAIEKGYKVVLGCFFKKKLVALSNVNRNFDNRERGRHVGIFGISVEKEFREEGIGFELAKTIIEEAKNKITGLKMVVLDVYGINNRAINLYRKLGFKEYGVLKAGIFYKGKYIDEVKMVLYC